MWLERELLILLNQALLILRKWNLSQYYEEVADETVMAQWQLKFHKLILCKALLY